MSSQTKTYNLNYDIPLNLKYILLNSEYIFLKALNFSNETFETIKFQVSIFLDEELRGGEVKILVLHVANQQCQDKNRIFRKNYFPYITEGSSFKVIIVITF